MNAPTATTSHFIRSPPPSIASTSAGSHDKKRPKQFAAHTARKKYADGPRLAVERPVVHELSIATSLVEAVCEELPRLNGATVRAIRIRVGSLSGVSCDALMFSFDAATDGSPIAGSSLEIERTDGRELEVVALEVIDAGSADR